MKKNKPLNIVIDVPERRRKVRKALPAALFRRLERKLTQRVKEVQQHFKKDKWDLSWRLIEAEIYNEVFGYDLEWYVMGRFLQAGPDRLVWDSEDSEFMLRRVADKRRKRPTLKRGRVTSKVDRRKVS